MKRMLRKNVRIIMLCCCLLGSWLSTRAQDLAWARSLVGTGYDAAKCVTVDAAGNTYVAGVFTATTDFDPGTGVQSMLSSGWDIFLLKLDTGGHFLWVKHFSPSSADILGEPSGIALDSLNNIYITGIFGSFGQAGSIDFDPGTGVQTLSTSGDLYTTDIFVLKLDSTGAFTWVKALKGSNDDQSTGIALDHDGNVFTTGFFKGTADFDPGSGVQNLVSASTYGNVFVSKLNNNGDFVWAKRLGSADVIRANAIKTDTAGNVFTLGVFSGTVDFDPNAGTANLVTMMGPYGYSKTNAFISKLSNDGNYIWAKQMGMPYNGYSPEIIATAMAVDISGNIIVTGSFADTADFDPGSGTANLVSTLTGVEDIDIFVAKLNNAGDFVWAKNMGGVTSELGYAVTTDLQGDVYTTGRFGGPADFNPSDTAEAVLTAPSQGGAIFISRLSASGNFKWARSIGGAQCGSGLNGMSIRINELDNAVHIASEFGCTTDFDPGPDTFNLIANTNNVFILKLNNCEEVTSEMAITACGSYNLNGTEYSQSGNYSQAYLTARGCDSIIALTLTIHPKPVATVTQAAHVLSANNAGAAYQWINCANNTPLAGATGQVFTATANGNYAVIVTSNGCSDTSDCYSVTSLGIDDVGREQSVQVYPNPVSATVTITSSAFINKGSIRLLNVLGQTVLQQANISGRQFSIQTASLAPGTYIVEVAGGAGISRIKIIKE